MGLKGLGCFGFGVGVWGFTGSDFGLGVQDFGVASHVQEVIAFRVEA